jgi:hypothetical protein
VIGASRDAEPEADWLPDSEAAFYKNKEKHKLTDTRKADNQEAESRDTESRLAEKQEAEIKEAEKQEAEYRDSDNRKADNQLANFEEATSPAVSLSPERSRLIESTKTESVPESVTESVPNSMAEPAPVREPIAESIPATPVAMTSQVSLASHQAGVINGSSGRAWIPEKAHTYHPSTDTRKADYRLSDFEKAVAEHASVGSETEENLRSQLGNEPPAAFIAPSAPKRSGGVTITNLAKRSLIQPDWKADFTRDESFLRGFFRQIFGNGKRMKEVDLYCQLYALAQQRQSISLHFLSAEIGGLVGSSSNGTIRTRLLTCEELGLFVQQGFNNETASHRRGTYIHLKFPWTGI